MPRQRNTHTSPPEGFHYQPEILVPEEESALIELICELPFKEFEFHGYVGKRRTVSFGWHYDFGEGKLRPADEIPPFLHSLRGRAASFAGVAADNLPHALVTEYSPGTRIGWHRDKGVFDEVIGISLLSPCILRFRKELSSTWERYS